VVRDLTLLEVRLQSRDGIPVVLLAEVGTGRVLPIWMSAGGASAIVSATDAEEPDRPGIHDLAVLLLGEARAVITEARIVGYSDGQFYAAVMVGAELVAARASDAIALALRAGCPIRATDAVMDAAAVAAAATTATEANVERAEGAEPVLEEFKAFLDRVSPDDF
jgi:bifunctional DNase/RNase